MKFLRQLFAKLLLISILLPAISISQPDSLSIQPNKVEGIEAFIDSLVLDGMEKYHVPGLSTAIITDSVQVFTKAYGFSNIEDQIPVDKAKTGFRIASITKTFTALAAMQLVEAGKLDLHVPVSIYLPDDNFEFLEDDPFTFHQLLTHTAGFDLTDTGDAALRAEDVVPLEELARYQMPDQVHKPGTVHSYSNFGFALAGYLIQEISGMAYEEYIRKNILEPLEMYNTDLSQPLPPELKKQLARSYVWKNGNQVYLPRDYTNTTPGGGIVSNAADMTNYMLMLLNGGAFKGKTIIGPEGFKLLTTQQYGSEQTKYGICYAFFENMWTTRRSLEHTGGQLGFLSIMVLIPETGTGFFLTHNNRKDAGGFRYDVMMPVLDTILGQKERNILPLRPPDNFDAIAKNYIGRYKQKNYPKATFEKFARALGSFTTEQWVSYKGGGIMDIRGEEFVMIDAEKHLFQSIKPESTYKMQFKVDDKGKAYEIFTGVNSYERVPWYLFKRVLQFGLIISMIILIIHVLVHPIRIRYLKNKGVKQAVRPEWIAKWEYGTAFLYALGAVGVAVISAFYADQMTDYGIPFILKLVLLIFTLAFALSCLAPFGLWQTVTNKELSIIGKLKDVIIILALIIASLTLLHFNMIGFKYY